MIGPNGQTITGKALVPAPSPKSATPVSGIWARFREGSPWLSAFPMGWVPVRSLMGNKVEGVHGDTAWDLDNPRCTSQQLHDLSVVLSQAGRGATHLILQGLQDGHRVALGAGHLVFVEDFTARKRCTWYEFPLRPKDSARNPEKGKTP